MACGSVAHSLSHFDGGTRGAESSFVLLLHRWSVALFKGRREHATAPTRRGDASHPSVDMGGRLGAWPGLRPLILEHRLLSSRRALYHGCQMALHFKSCCLSITGQRRQVLSHKTRSSGEQGGMLISETPPTVACF